MLGRMKGKGGCIEGRLTDDQIPILLLENM